LYQRDQGRELDGLVEIRKACRDPIGAGVEDDRLAAAKVSWRSTSPIRITWSPASSWRTLRSFEQRDPARAVARLDVGECVVSGCRVLAREVVLVGVQALTPK
jgi:hypothetical protein